jgi:hypothetical protein
LNRGTQNGGVSRGCLPEKEKCLAQTGLAAVVWSDEKGNASTLYLRVGVRFKVADADLREQGTPIKVVDVLNLSDLSEMYIS